MVITVRASGAPADVLDRAGSFLAADPIRNHLILRLLHGRVRYPAPGRYWVAEGRGRCAGVVFQSPLHFVATLTPMDDDAVCALVEAIAGEGVRLPGVTGVAATAARFAGHWAETTRASAAPRLGQRLYEVERVVPPRPAPGRIRLAGAGDEPLLLQWFAAFGRETGEGGANPDLAAAVRRRVESGALWVWDDDGPVSMAGLSDTHAGVACVGPVYTPPERRSRGYASALVAGLSQGALDRPGRCVLYTDLANPVSNGIYRAIGYRAVAEVLRYEFTPE
ncbi:MAG TPA: GNAT family N-acetyltransferase [Acidimicrobiales bacterium]|nr:GNAT family N-acetyltransferase [Acidimicrobiales bacterium]